MAFDGLWLIWVRGTYLTIPGALSSTLLAALILTSAAMTLHHARAGRSERHRRWAVRLFLVVNGVWFQRIGYVAWMILARGPVGIGKHMDGPLRHPMGIWRVPAAAAVLRALRAGDTKQRITGEVRDGCRAACSLGGDRDRQCGRLCIHVAAVAVAPLRRDLWLRLIFDDSHRQKTAPHRG